MCEWEKAVQTLYHTEKESLGNTLGDYQTKKWKVSLGNWTERLARDRHAGKGDWYKK